jgi:methionyl-tRNA synthetase
LHERPTFPKRAIVTAGMPYGNKGLHFGHIAGVFVPADIYARFLRDRLGRENVLFVSGTDCYGSPINEGYRKLVEAGEFSGSIADYVMRNHERQAKTMENYDISLDIYEGSAIGLAGEIHAEVTERFIRRLYENGWLEKRSTPQFYDTQAQTFLNGRQVIGRCPVQGCKSEKAYADECDLGHQFLPEDLIAPKSTLTGTVPELRPVTNWYLKLPELSSVVSEHIDNIADDPTTRAVTVNTVREFLVPPVIYVKQEFLEVYESVKDKLPAHRFTPVEKGKASFTLEFDDIDARDEAKGILSAAGIAKFRTGKALVPFRITGNIDWGVAAPQLEDEGPLTVWCWPESLWAPISFSTAALVKRGEPKESWRDWWCSDDAAVYQFIGQDNIYFYGVAQTALWAATQGEKVKPEGTGDELRQTTLVPNYHILYLGKKASSSGKVKPPMADELLEHYTVEQLRAHWAALGLDVKSASFSPKPFNPDADEKAPDPVLKEGALLTNIFNRIARSCFYTAQKHNGGFAPLAEPSDKAKAACEEAICTYEEHMYRFEIHSVMAQMDEFLRGINKWWSSASREALNGDDPEGDIIPVLADAFHYLRCAVVLMHPVVPRGTELIYSYLDITDHGSRNGHAGFFDWDHIFEPLSKWAEPEEKETGKFTLKELPPHFDFFEKHESQLK